ncbi:MAG: DUF2634 domain-containing protein [Lachnospiraceae bacterium]|nr:DUF2634 domain-containing protein [Lachnospiraceae bacterium]
MAETLFPVFEVPEITVPTQGVNRPYQPSVYFDYDKGDFRLDGSHKMTVSTGYETYMQWCRKVVCTERDRCLAYSTDIGIEGESALAQQTHEAVESALERTITEALMVNVHTEYVRNFEFEWSADALNVSFTVKGKQWQETTLETSYTT